MNDIVKEAITRPVPLGTELEPQVQSGLISPATYEHCAGQWLALLSGGDEAALERSFRAANGQQVAYVSFPVQRIVELVSASATGRIEARFVLKPDASGEPRMTLVLFATDVKGLRVSSYYAADEFSTAVAAPLKMHTPKAKAGPSVHNEVASVLVNHWRQNWADKAASVDMFRTAYGPLQGYSFEPTDFLSLLFKLTSFGQQEIRLHFVLHAYHRSTAAGQDIAASTLGLAVQLASPRARLDEDDSDYDSDYIGEDEPPFTDMAQTHPPY